MRGSQLDRRITIEAKTIVKDPDYGSEIETWLPITSGARIPANVLDTLPSKSESVQQGIRVATQPARIRIRYRPDVTSAMRIIVHGDSDRLCQIVGGPAEIGRREWLEMVVENYSS